MIDFEIDTCERLKIVETKPEIKFQFVGETMPIGEDCFKEIIEKHSATVFLVLPFDQAMEMKRAYEAQQKQ